MNGCKTKDFFPQNYLNRVELLYEGYCLVLQRVLCIQSIELYQIGLSWVAIVPHPTSHVPILLKVF